MTTSAERIKIIEFIQPTPIPKSFHWLFQSTSCGGRQLSRSSFESKHPIILHSKDKINYLHWKKWIIARRSNSAASLAYRCHIVGGRKVIRSVTRACNTCRHNAAKPQLQKLKQLPLKKSCLVLFENVGVDYPVLIKRRHMQQPTIIRLTFAPLFLLLWKRYISVAFIACPT